MADEHVPTREVVDLAPSAADPLVGFYWARLDEREQAALAASPGPWKPNAEHDEVTAVDDVTVADGFALSGPQLRATVDHIADNDPAHALEDVAAKKAILDDYARYCADLDNPAREVICQVTRDVIKRLATVHAGHPDYREDFRP